MKNNIKKVLKKIDLPQKVVAERIGVKPSYLNRVISGKTIPSIEMALEISHAIGVDVNNLWYLE